MTNDDEIIGYAIEPRRLERLRAISMRLNDPRSLTWDERRYLANMIDLIASEAIPFNTKDLGGPTQPQPNKEG